MGVPFVALILLIVLSNAQQYFQLGSPSQGLTQSAEEMGYSAGTTSSFAFTCWLRYSAAASTETFIFKTANFNASLNIVNEFSVALDSLMRMKVLSTSYSLQFATASTAFEWYFMGLSASTGSCSLCMGRWGASEFACSDGNLGTLTISKSTIIYIGGTGAFKGELYDLKISSRKSKTQLNAIFTAVTCHAICRSACFGPTHTACNDFLSLVDGLTPVQLDSTEYIVYNAASDVFRGKPYTELTDLAVTGWVHSTEIALSVKWCSLVWFRNYK